MELNDFLRTDIAQIGIQLGVQNKDLEDFIGKVHSFSESTTAKPFAKFTMEDAMSVDTTAIDKAVQQAMNIKADLTDDAVTVSILELLFNAVGAGNAKKGFHDRTNSILDRCWDGGYEDTIREHINELLMLVTSELVEAHDELRNGHEYGETYYSGDKQPAKPEGFISEAVDAMIRLMDLFARLRIARQAAEMFVEKRAYNATRPYMHGGKKS